ncbi:malectin domain-containing carbohydrate-binding protein, partial [Arenibacter palladensis]|uniref:PKD domain-containing protein n=1 Tax=Arenibacter palladensis TaxID=237373 RepID=UPI002FD0B0AD
DIDNDGDLDVISNGWLNHKVPRIYENTTLSLNNEDPVVNAGEDQSIILPLNNITLNGTGSDPDGGAVSFLWTQISGPNTATLSGDTTADLSASNLLEGDYVFRLTVTDDETDTAFDEVTVSVLPERLAIRINSGGPEYTFGAIEWFADQYFSGGSTTNNAIEIANTANDQLYQTERYTTSGTLVYEIPVTTGTYDLNLHFAEIYYGVIGPGASGGAGSRVFNVDIENGQKQLSNYDIVVAAGGSATAVVEEFTGIVVDDGNLSITLTSVVEFPKVSGIEVLVSGASSLQPLVDAGGDRTITLPNNNMILDGSAVDPDGGVIGSYQWTQVSGPNTATLNNEETDNLSVSDLVVGSYIFRLTAIDDDDDIASDEMVLTVLSEPVALRINSGGPTLDFNGEAWNADQYFVGGSVSSSGIAIANTENDALYQTERFSTSAAGVVYEIPVVNGNHNLNLHFAEIYFGVPGPGSSGGIGSRVFHIDIENGTQRIDNYDIVAAAGGSATAVVETFSNIEVTDGSLTITLIPVTQFPKISGIEFIESRPPNVDAGLDQSITLPTNSVTQNASGMDPDGGSVTFLWSQVSGPGTATLTGEDTADLTVSDLILGTYIFRLTVTDDENDASSDEVAITVSPDPNNAPPVAIASANPINGMAPLAVEFIGSNSTDDVQVVGFEWDFNDGTPISTEPDPVHTFIGEGIYNVQLTVTDGELSHTTSVEITVTGAISNQAPEVINPGSQNSAEGDVISLQVAATDPEGDGLTYTAVTLPTGLAMDAATGLISGTIATGAASNSPYAVEVTVTDDGTPSEPAMVSFIWNVTDVPVNQAPVVTNPGVQNSLVGTVVSLQIAASDAEDDGMTYSAITLPTGLSIDAATGLISGTIATGAASSSPYAVEVSVTDDGTPTESTTVSFTWNVTVGPSNGAPVAVATANIESGSVPLVVTFTGSNSMDDVGITSYLWDFKDGTPTNSTADPVHVFEEPGVYRVELTVSDGFLTDSEFITITVTESEETMKAVIAPNPSNGIAQVYVLNADSDDFVRVIYLHDSTGKYLTGILNPQIVNGYYEVPVHTLQDGVYYITLFMEGDTMLPVRLVVKND